jgi:putative FmdB family regulatory protein
MPIYEYVCSSCRYSFEVRQRFSDDPVTACPECGGAVHRLLFPAGIIFKGSGFYSTDYRKSSSTNGHESTTSSATTPAGATRDED